MSDSDNYENPKEGKTYCLASITLSGLVINLAKLELLPSPEIITFDELYERSKYIVQHNES